jgi:methyl-accepting chemotaxis protein
MSAANPYSRKRLFVNRAIQGRLLARTALYWMLYHGVLWIAMFLYRYAEHRGAVLAGAEPRSFADLYGQFVREHFSMWVCSIAIMPIVMWDLLKFSHRVVGPLIPFQRAIERLTAGEKVSEVRLRQDDLLSDLQHSFNQYLISLRTMESNAEMPVHDSEAVDADTPVPTIVADLIESQLAEELQKVDAELQASCAHRDGQASLSRSSAEQMVS